jgi:3-oxoacyl-[acyl-carrier-protein] synthase III
MTTYITSMGRFLPGEPIDNESMEAYLGKINGKPSRARRRVLKQNGIEARYYAIDREQRTLISNAEMAARAVRCAIERGGHDLATVDFLAAATSQGDHPLPGFASMVHAELGSPACEIATLHGVCASGVMALKTAMLHVGSGKRMAVACASELASRLFKSSRFEAQEHVRRGSLGFDVEFLRWMLSDGAGAAVLQRAPDVPGLCFEVDWIELKSYANLHGPCMYVGPENNGGRIASWLDYPSYHAAADAGAINLRQDMRMLGEVVAQSVQGAVELVQRGQLNPGRIDWLVVHYSSQVFIEEAYQSACRSGFEIPRERWFTNLRSTGNVGSASIFVLLEELLYSGRLEPGQKIFCIVPESGRFLFGYLLLTVVGGEHTAPRPVARASMPRTEPPSLRTSDDPLAKTLVRQLAEVWFDFDARLRQVPIVARMYDGSFTLEDYRALLFNLRQQVIEGSRWIARAASSITPEYFPIRAAFIAHTSDEHRDFEMLERNYAMAGGTLEDIRAGQKNIGSEALSSYVLQRASLENPFDLVGAMFIVEGLGQRVARQWGERIQARLGLPAEAVSFFLYHSESDVQHFQRLDQAIAAGILTDKLVADIVRCAKVTARLYALQLEEIGHF